MIIPSRLSGKKLRDFVRELIEQCSASRVSRANQNALMTNYALTGSDSVQSAALYNKTYAYLDDVQSLLYSPVSLRFHIGNPDVPNILEAAKGRMAASKLRRMARRSDTDTRISEAIWWSLVKGKALMKSDFKRGSLGTTLVQPDAFGVRHENHTKLDEDMEAFVYTTWISPEQFARAVWNRRDRDTLIRQARTHVQQDRMGGMTDGTTQKQIVVGGLYPFQPAGSQSANNTRGIVDWMGSPKPQLAPDVVQTLMPLDELWVWSDEDEDWCTYQMVGELMVMGDLQRINAFAHDIQTHQSTPALKGHHPFSEFSVNPIDGYFWGRSEILNVALLQEAINSRITGINSMLRMQEKPTTKIIGSGINQVAWSKYNKPGGYYVDQNPQAKIERDKIEISNDLWASLQQYERMFDEMGGLPPIARGHGEAGVRSHGHAEALIRMFSPRFKDRALIAERDVEALGGLHLDMARAHVPTKLLAWVPAEAAGLEGMPPDPLLQPPAEGMVAVPFTFASLEDDVELTIDSHSSSPAFAAEAKALVFDLVKIGAMTAEDVVTQVDVSDPDELIAGIQRRAIARQKQEQQALGLKLLEGGKGKK